MAKITMDKAVRLAMGYPASEFAKYADVNEGTLARYESGKENMQANTVHRIQEAVRMARKAFCEVVGCTEQQIDAMAMDIMVSCAEKAHAYPKRKTHKDMTTVVETLKETVAPKPISITDDSYIEEIVAYHTDLTIKAATLASVSSISAVIVNILSKESITNLEWSVHECEDGYSIQIKFDDRDESLWGHRFIDMLKQRIPNL